MKKNIFIILISLVASCASENDTTKMVISDHIVHENLPTGSSPELNGRDTGESANEILSSNKYKSLTLEILAVEGTPTNNTAINHLTSFIKKRCNKPNGINIIYKTISKPSDDNNAYSTSEIAQIEIKNRQFFNSEDNIAIHIFFADRENENSKENISTLGTAYLNTSIVIYEPSIKRLTQNDPIDTFDIVKSNVLIHEFCHLLGLVNIGTPMIENHEDFEESDNGEKIGGHCNIRNCLMEAQANFFIDATGQLSTMELDDLCIQDLKNNGGK